MMLARVFVVGCVLAMTLPVVAEESGGGGSSDQQMVQRVVQLHHADAAEATDLIRSTLRCRSGVDARTNSVVISGPADQVAAAEQMLAKLDVPASEDADESSALVRLGRGSSDRIMDLIRTQLSRRTSVAFDPDTGLLALRGSAAEIQAVREFITQMEAQADEENGRTRPTPAVRVSFFFLIAQTDPENQGDANSRPPAPDALSPAVDVLQENGFYRPALLMPLLVHVESDEGYNVSGRTDLDGTPLVVEINGDAEIASSGDTANLYVNASIVEDTESGEGGKQVFEIGSRLSARIGDLVVLAAAPIADGGLATALVVRIVPAE